MASLNVWLPCTFPTIEKLTECSAGLRTSDMASKAFVHIWLLDGCNFEHKHCQPTVHEGGREHLQQDWPQDLGRIAAGYNLKSHLLGAFFPPHVPRRPAKAHASRVACRP